MSYLSFDIANKSLAVSLISFNKDYKETINNHLNKINYESLLNSMKDLNTKINDILKYHIFEVTDLIPQQKVRETTLIYRSAKLKTYLNELNNRINKIKNENNINKLTVLIEYKPSFNEKSRTIYNQIIYEYSNDSLYTVYIMNPLYKNKIYFSNELKHSKFIQKYNNNYIANKNHTKQNFLYYLNIYNLEYIIKKIKKKNLFLSIGRLTKQKNYKNLIYTFNEFIKFYPNYKLEIVGDGDQKEDLIFLISKLNLKNKKIKYVIIDLCESIICSYSYLNLEFPDKSHVMVTEKSDFDRDFDILYVPITFLKDFIDSKKITNFDLCINTCSFGEMCNETVNNYYNLITNVLNVKSVYWLNRFLDNGTQTENSNACMTNIPKQWHVKYWKRIPKYLECPYIMIYHAKYVEMYVDIKKHNDVYINTTDELYNLWNINRLIPNINSVESMIKYIENILPTAVELVFYKNLLKELKQKN